MSRLETTQPMPRQTPNRTIPGERGRSVLRSSPMEVPFGQIPCGCRPFAHPRSPVGGRRDTLGRDENGSPDPATESLEVRLLDRSGTGHRFRRVPTDENRGLLG